MIKTGRLSIEFRNDPGREAVKRIIRRSVPKLGGGRCGRWILGQIEASSDPGRSVPLRLRGGRGLLRG
jgi:hypothetical protein